MKTNFFLLLLCSYFLAISSTSAQSNFYFKFRVYINGVNYGDYDLNTTDYGILQKVNSSQPDIPDLCPGDEITLRNNCVYNSSNHTFDGINNPFNRPTIGLTPVAGCSDPTPPENYIPILHLADVCSSCTIPNWNYNTPITVTYNYTPDTYNYLAIAAGGTTNVVTNCLCGHRIAYLPLNFGDKPTPLDDLTICPTDVVNLNLDPDCTYSNWSPNNPNGNTLSTTSNYTVDIENTASGCSINDNFTISVQNPDINLFLPSELCYTESIEITEEDFYDLQSNQTLPYNIMINGVLMAGISNGNFTMNLPHIIDATNYGAGVVTIEYTYERGGIVCSKIYEVTIHPEIVLDMQNSYGFCNNNFQAICANTSGIAQPGITYVWRKDGVAFAVGAGVCYTPSSYGSYSVTAHDAFGCLVNHSFTVYDSGVGIKHPPNITFCSMKYSIPSYIGWSSDPFGLVQNNFNWTYTNQNGATVSIPNTGVQYQVPYLGPGTYTTVVTSGGCTETINITVTDLLQIHNNHLNAAFGFTPLLGNQVSCQPNTNIFGVTNIWTVVDQYGTTIPFIPLGTGIKFAYTTGIEYSVTLRRESPKYCQVFINQYTWLDNFKKNRRNYVSNKNTTLNSEPTTLSSFPNPTTGLVNIQLKNVETTETSIQVLNTLGQVIIDRQIQNKSNIEIDLSQEISGIYLLHIVNGESQFTEKVIKE